MSAEARLTYCPPQFQIEASGVQHLAVLRYTDAAAARLLVVRRETSGALTVVRDTTGALDLVAVIDALLTAGLHRVGALWVIADTAAARASLQADAYAIIQRCEEGRVTLGPLAYVLPFTAHELSAGKHTTNELAGLVCQRRAGGLPMGVYFTWVGRTWPLDELKGSGARGMWEWLGGVSLAADALDCQVRFSPSYMGVSMLRQTVRDMERRRRGPLPRQSDAMQDMVRAHAARYLSWRRPIRPVLEAMDHGDDLLIPVYVYDRNWSFVSSAREAPIGEPRAVSGEVIEHRPGLYKVTSAGPVTRINGDAPLGPLWQDDHSPIGNPEGWQRHGVFDTWAWEPQIRAARMLGWYVSVDHGWYWPETVDLRPWQARLWQARRMARDATRAEYGRLSGLVNPSGRIAESIIKRAGVAGIGRLNQTRGRAVMRTARAKDEQADIIVRHTDADGAWTGYADVATTTGRADMEWPAWWSTIISNATERLQHALYTYARDDCFLAYVDAVYCLRRHPELERDAWDKPGGFRLAATLYIHADDLDGLEELSPYALAVRLATVSSREGLDTTGELEAVRLDETDEMDQEGA